MYFNNLKVNIQAWMKLRSPTSIARLEPSSITLYQALYECWKVLKQSPFFIYREMVLTMKFSWKFFTIESMLLNQEFKGKTEVLGCPKIPLILFLDQKFKLRRFKVK